MPIQKNVTLSQTAGRAPLRVGNWSSLLALQVTSVGAESANHIDVEIQIITDDGQDWVGQEVFALRVSDVDKGPASATATLTLGGSAKGAIVEGSGTAEIRLQTDVNGQASVRITESAVASRYLTANQTFGGSHYMRGFGTQPLSFT